jgi:hypothetical protein
MSPRCALHGHTELGLAVKRDMHIAAPGTGSTQLLTFVETPCHTVAVLHRDNVDAGSHGVAVGWHTRILIWLNAAP